MRFYLLLLTHLINVFGHLLVASEQEYDPSSASYVSYRDPHFLNNDSGHRFTAGLLNNDMQDDSYDTFEKTSLGNIYRNKADQLFTEALAYGTLYSREASDLYAQAGMYYSSIIKASSSHALQEIYQRAILSHFRSAFYQQDYDKVRAHWHFTECSSLLYDYVARFRLNALHQDYLVCKMLFNKMVSFFETLENAYDEKLTINLYLAFGDLSLERLDILAEGKTPQDYLRPAIAYYNAAYLLRRMDKASACFYYHLSYELHSQRLNLLGSEATAQDLRWVTQALHNYYNLKEASDLFLCIHFLDLELRRLALVGERVTSMDYQIIAVGNYNLAYCYPYHSQKAAICFENAVNYESFYLHILNNDKNVQQKDPYMTYLIYSKAAEALKPYDPYKANLLSRKAEKVKPIFLSINNV